MTNEEIEKQVMTYCVPSICYCRAKGIVKCKQHREIAELARTLVAQAYEEAARLAENDPALPCAGVAARIRALRDELRTGAGRGDAKFLFY